jgi:hypothetical protein
MAGLDDLIVTVEDLHQQGIPYSASLTEFTFKGQQFKKHLSFRKSLIESGMDYCRLALGRKELCFLVLEETTFTIWRAVQDSASAVPNFPSQADTAKLTTPQAGLFSASSIEPEFLNRCRQTMVHYIGSVADQYIQATLAQFPSLTHRQFVDKLAMYIADPQQAEEFWQQVLTGSMPSDLQQTAPTSSPPSPLNQPPQELSNSQFKRTYRGISY